jgi:hypothetical protein
MKTILRTIIGETKAAARTWTEAETLAIVITRAATIATMNTPRRAIIVFIFVVRS